MYKIVDSYWLTCTSLSTLRFFSRTFGSYDVITYVNVTEIKKKRGTNDTFGSSSKCFLHFFLFALPPSFSSADCP